MEAEKRAEKEAHRARKAAASKVRRAAPSAAAVSTPPPVAAVEAPPPPARETSKMQLGAPAETMLHDVVAAAMSAGTSGSGGSSGGGTATVPHPRRVSSTSTSGATDALLTKRQSSARQLEMPSAPVSTVRGPQEHTGADMSSTEASGPQAFMQGMFGGEEGTSRRLSSNDMSYQSPRYARAVAAPASGFPISQGMASTPNDTTASMLSYQSANTTPVHPPFSSSFNPPSPASPPLMQRGVMQPIPSSAITARMQQLSCMQQPSASSYTHSSTLAAETSSMSMHRTSSTGLSLLTAADDSLWRFQQPATSACAAATSDPISANAPLGWGTKPTSSVGTTQASPQRPLNRVSAHADSSYGRLHSSVVDRSFTSSGLGLRQGAATSLWGAPTAQDSSRLGVQDNSGLLLPRDEGLGNSDGLSGGLARQWHLGDSVHHGDVAGDISNSWTFSNLGQSAHARAGLSEGVGSSIGTGAAGLSNFPGQQPLRSGLPASSMHSHSQSTGKILGDSGSKLTGIENMSSAARPGLFAFGAPGASVFSSGGGGASSWGTVDVSRANTDTPLACDFSSGFGASEGQRLIRQDMQYGVQGTHSRDPLTRQETRPLVSGAIGFAIPPTPVTSGAPEIAASAASSIQWPEGLLPQHKDSEFNVHAAEFQVRRQPRVSIADLGLPHDLME